MKYVVLAAVLACGLAACSVSHERTVVAERPVPTTSAVVVADPPPATVVVRE